MIGDYNQLPKHLIHVILENTSRNNASIIFMDKTENYHDYSYLELWSDIKIAANDLVESGVKSGDVVSLILPTSKEFLSYFFAAQLIRAIPAAIYPPSSITNLDSWSKKTKSMLESVDSKVLVTNKKIEKFCYKLKSETTLKFFCTEDSSREEISKNSYDLELLNDNDICFIQFSSGTTGNPKPIVISQKNAILNVYAIIDSLPSDAEDVDVVSWLPLYHDMGLIGGLMTPIIGGSKLVLIKPEDFIYKPSLWLRAITDHRLHTTTAPNFSYGLVAKRISKEEIQKFNLSSMNAFLCGAEMVQHKTVEKFLEFLKPAKLNPNSFTPVYGMAETTLAISFGDFKKFTEPLKLDPVFFSEGKVVENEEGIPVYSVGKLLKTFQARIISNDGEVLADDEIGNIQVVGPCVSQGIYKGDSLLENGWLDTGDKGFFHKDELYICGRSKDIMIIRGANFYPSFYEEKISEINGVRKGRVVVSSLYNEATDSEEIIVLAEVNKELTKERRDELQKTLNDLILKEGLPLLKVVLLETGTLLKTSSGKIQRKKNVDHWINKTLEKSKFQNSKLNTLYQIGKINLLNIKNNIFNQENNNANN